jgi:hypothetical protein
MARIGEIRLTGTGQTDAIVKFRPGPNVVTGDSDTGKSYLLRLVDYVLGAEELKKVIDEAAGYETAWVEFADSDGDTLTLERHLTGGDVRAYSRSIEEVRSASADVRDEEEGSADPEESEVLAWRREGRSEEPDVTSRLFPFFGMSDNVRLRRNADGQHQRLSIRTLLPTFMVDEESIITEDSAILRGSFGDTADKRMFSYLLTGKDDKDIVARDPQKMVSARTQAQRDLIVELLEPLNARLKDHTESEEDESVERLEETIDNLSNALANNSDERTRLRQRRNELYHDLLRAETQTSAVDAMLTRYALLDERYSSDLQRLDFISESSHYYGGLQDSMCPMCGQSLEGVSHEHEEATGLSFRADEVYQSAVAEAAKIRGLQTDLKSAISDLESRGRYWADLKKTSSDALVDIDRQLDTDLAPARRSTRNSLNELVARRVELETVRSDRMEAARLGELRDKLDRELAQPAAKQVWAPLDPMAVTDLCKEIEAVLREWSWKEDVRVEFEEARYDIKVNGKPRRSHGKGFRAVIHAAFSVGLLRFCHAKGRPHPGFVVLDSPLTTVKQRKGEANVEQAESDEITPGIEPSFWKSISEINPSIQIIILDNKEPPPNLFQALNVQLFAGPDADEGEREGFIPTRANRSNGNASV